MLRKTSVMRKCLRILFILVLALGVAVLGRAETDADASCVHLWVPYSESINSVLPEEIELSEVTELTHMYMQWMPKEVCSLCGKRMYRGSSGSEVPHSYTVTQWERIQEGRAVRITLNCGVCQYSYTYEVTVQTLLDGTGKNCLQGGLCDTHKEGYLFENGMILFDTKGYQLPVDFEPGEAIRPMVLVYDPDEQTFLLTERSYCPTCGRPRTSRFSPQTEFNSNWNGLQIMTMEYFLTNGVPENLPYQLLDQIRQEAGDP